MYLQRYSDALLSASSAEKDQFLLLCTINFYCFTHTAMHIYNNIHSVSLEVPVVMLFVKQTFLCNLNFMLQYFSCCSPCFLAMLVTGKFSYLFFQLKLFNTWQSLAQGFQKGCSYWNFFFLHCYIWVRIFSQSSWSAVVNCAKFALLESATTLTLSHLLPSAPITTSSLLSG